MAYLMTAVMTGGVSAILSLFQGGSIGEIFWNYILFGHLGMAVLALAVLATTMADRRANQ